MNIKLATVEPVVDTYSITVTERELRILEEAVCYADDHMEAEDFEVTEVNFDSEELRDIWRSFYRATENLN